MKIFGVGTDMVNIKRIEKLLISKNQSFKKRIFTKKEITYCEKKINSSCFFAKRYAAKEAFAKALGLGIRQGVTFKNIEISNNNLGKPMIKLKGSTFFKFKKVIKSKKYQIDLSISDDKPWAHATVIISYTK